jgi:hypothetical protein
MGRGSNGGGNLFPSNVDRGSVLTPRLMGTPLPKFVVLHDPDPSDNMSTRQRHINVRHPYIDTSM